MLPSQQTTRQVVCRTLYTGLQPSLATPRRQAKIFHPSTALSRATLVLHSDRAPSSHSSLPGIYPLLYGELGSHAAARHALPLEGFDNRPVGAPKFSCNKRRSSALASFCVVSKKDFSSMLEPVAQGLTLIFFPPRPAIGLPAQRIYFRTHSAASSASAPKTCPSAVTCISQCREHSYFVARHQDHRQFHHFYVLNSAVTDPAALHERACSYLI